MFYIPAHVGLFKFLLIVTIYFVLPVSISVSEEDMVPRFSLQDMDGLTVSEDTLLGRYHLVFFGYRSCPDVCPLTLSELSKSVSSLESKFSDLVAPVFISVDHERDKHKKLKAYVNSFHPKMKALWGNEEQTKSAAYNFNVFFGRLPSRDPMDYEISHTSSTFLVDPAGRIIDVFEFGTNAKTISKQLEQVFSAADKLKK